VDSAEVLQSLALAFSSTRFFAVRFVAKQYILEQKCLKGHIGTCLLGTRWRWCNFQPCTPTVRVRMHRRTDRQTDRRQDSVNSRS